MVNTKIFAWNRCHIFILGILGRETEKKNLKFPHCVVVLGRARKSSGKCSGSGFIGLGQMWNIRARALRFGLFGFNGLNVAYQFAMKFILFWPKMDQKFISALDLNFYCIFMLQFAKYYQVLTRFLKNS